MSASEVIAIGLPLGDVQLEAPPDMHDTVRLFYPAAAAGGEQLASFRIWHSGGRWRLGAGDRAAGDFQRPVHALLGLEFEIEQLLLERRGELLAIHAGSCVVGSAACLLAGTPEAGKTSCTFQLAELGHPFLSEEVTLVEPGSWTVLPFLQTPTLEGGLVEEFRRHARFRHGTLHPLHRRLWRYLPARLGAPAPARHIVLPRYQRGAPGGVERLTAEQALAEFLGYCFEPAGDRERFLEQVIGLLEATTVLRLSYGDAGEARRLLAAACAEPPA